MRHSPIELMPPETAPYRPTCFTELEPGDVFRRKERGETDDWFIKVDSGNARLVQRMHGESFNWLKEYPGWSIEFLGEFGACHWNAEREVGDSGITFKLTNQGKYDKPRKRRYGELEPGDVFLWHAYCDPSPACVRTGYSLVFLDDWADDPTPPFPDDPVTHLGRLVWRGDAPGEDGES